MAPFRKYIRDALRSYIGNRLSEIEAAIVKGAITANHQHDTMIGYWLDSAPESFLNTHIGMAIAETDHGAYVDISFKRMSNDLDWIRRGRRPDSLSQRPDITVIKRSEEKIKSIVETKIAYTTTGPKKDIEKLQNYLRVMNTPPHGYLFVFTYSSSVTGSERVIKLLKEKLQRWATDEAKLRMLYVCPDTYPEDGKTYGWAIALYRVKP